MKSVTELVPGLWREECVARAVAVGEGEEVRGVVIEVDRLSHHCRLARVIIRCCTLAFEF